MHVSFSQEDPHAGPAFLINIRSAENLPQLMSMRTFGTEKKFMFFLSL